MKNTFAIVTLTLSLAGCAGWSARPTAIATQDLPSEPVSAPQAHDKAQTPAEPLPNFALTEDLLFNLINAEIASQRGQWQAAYVVMLAAAQQTRDPRLARRAAEIALNARQMEEALSALWLWHDLAPNSEEAAQYLLGMIVLGDDLSNAQPLLTQRLHAAPARGAMILQTQHILARAKNKAQAFAMLDALLKPYPALPETHIALAQGAWINGDSARARTEAQAALAAQSDSELAALTWVKVSSDKEAVLPFLATFLAKHPRARAVRIAYARLLIEQAQYAQARQVFEYLLKAEPDDLSNLYAVAMLSAQLNDTTAAERYLTTYLHLLAKNPNGERDPTQALLVLAQIAEQRHDMEGALAWLSQIEPGENYLSAQIKRAQILAKRGNLADARALLADFKSETEHEQIQLISAQAQLLQDANHPDEAMAVYATGIEHFPNNTDLLYDYALMAEKNNQPDLMETTLRKVIALAPQNQHAYNALGYSLAERNIRLPEALELINTALKLAPDDAFIIDSLGWVQFRLGRLAEAEASLRRAYGLRTDPEIAVHLGEVLWVKGKKDDAQKLWRDANSKDPKNDTLKNTLTRLRASLSSAPE